MKEIYKFYIKQLYGYIDYIACGEAPQEACGNKVYRKVLLSLSLYIIVL